MFNNLPAIPVTYSTTIDRAASNTAEITVQATLLGTVDHYLISLAPAFKDKVVKFDLPMTEAADRRPISGVDARLRALSTAVFQIQMIGSGEDSAIGGVSQDKGTGFFISPDGYLLTNHHVVAGQPDCLRVQRCKLRTMRTSPDGNRTYVDLDVQLMATDTKYDFALLKANLPAGTTVHFIKPEKTNIGPDLVTLGYPGDEVDQIDGEDVNRLTYSFGKLMGFRSKAYITSVYIYAGASGSPILNSNTLSLVALNSNGASAMGVDGAPAIAQSIQEIDRIFGIYSYISGEKQRQVNEIIYRLSLSSSFEEAARLMDHYLGARTMYGRSRLKMIMTNSDSRDVRRAIFQKLNLD
jgi:S1-C subfamily serine protease